jgi:hypothetical protein
VLLGHAVSLLQPVSPGQGPSSTSHGSAASVPQDCQSWWRLVLHAALPLRHLLLLMMMMTLNGC